MSLAQNPLTGQMRQSMANFVTTVYRGQNVIRAKVFMPKDVNSIAQQKQRASFKLIVDAYEALGGMSDIGFPKRPVTYSPYNAFLVANLPGAVNKTGAVPVIDYTRLVVSNGSLPKVIVPTAVAGAAGITLSYKTALLTPKVSATDEVIAIALLKTGELAVAPQVRGTQEMGSILISYAGISADEVECCYLFAVKEDGSNVSDSTFVVVD
ncbi:MAG: DUF6266 family protein [Paludibacter sp.]|nr:DUF6266 family protein [Paludibacter sp.]